MPTPPPPTSTRSFVYALDLTWGIWRGLSLRGTFSLLHIMASKSGTGMDEAEAAGTVDESSLGIGDTPVVLEYLFRSRDATPSPWSFGFGAGAYLPTGTGVREDFPSNSSFVSGTVDPVLALSGSLNPIPAFGFYAHGVGRLVVGENGDGYRAGSSFVYGAGVRLRFSGSLGFSFGLNVLHKLADERAPDRDDGTHMEMTFEEGSGGSWLYLAPALSYLFVKGPLEGLSFQLSLQAPVYQRVNGIQLADDLGATLAVGYGFSMYGS
jgi:hypothetical protein